MTVAQLSFKRNWDIFLPIYFKSLPLLTPIRSGDVESILREAFLFILDLDLMKYSLRQVLFLVITIFVVSLAWQETTCPKYQKRKTSWESLFLQDFHPNIYRPRRSR